MEIVVLDLHLKISNSQSVIEVLFYQLDYFIIQELGEVIKLNF